MSETSPGTPLTSLWREENAGTFQATVLAAADQLKVQPLAVEKDYWVCEALRAISSAHPGEVVFKGGTSLEKLGLIRRFSEDLDLLVIGNYTSLGDAKRALKAMCATAADALGAEIQDHRSGGGRGTFHRSIYLAAPLETTAAARSNIADPGRVMIELGQSGGRNPHAPEPVTSLLARQLAAVGEAAGFPDLEPFDVNILHPGRTLLEKLFRVSAFVADPDSASEHGWPRIGRQFYDIFCLLGDGRVQALLSDEEVVSDIVQSCIEISESAYKQAVTVPLGGFANCPAFHPGHEFASRLRDEHERAMEDLYYGSEEPPSFDAVMNRIQESAALLRCGAGQ